MVETFAAVGRGSGARLHASSIELSLSVKTIAPPCWVCDQPSGTLTEYGAPGGRNVTNAWSSGMSPGGLTSVGAGVAALRAVEDEPHALSTRTSAAMTSSRADMPPTLSPAGQRAPSARSTPGQSCRSAGHRRDTVDRDDPAGGGRRRDRFRPHAGP